MLKKWREFVSIVDPDLIIGYNITNFDFPYLIDRGSALKIDVVVPPLGRIKGKRGAEFLLSLSTTHIPFSLFRK